MVEVFRLVRELSADDGTLWLNLGDSYYGSWGNSGQRPELDNKSDGQRDKNTEYLPRGGWDNRRERPASSYRSNTLKPKDLVGIPWMLAFALRADGWYLRQDIIWSKPNPMPESVTDRCTKSHEYIFLLAKSAKYFYNAEAIAESVSPAMLAQMEQGYDGRSTKDFTASGAQDASATKARIIAGKRASWNGSDFDSGKTGEMMDTRGGKIKRPKGWASSGRHDAISWATSEAQGRGGYEEQDWSKLTRNKRSVWTVTTKPFSGAHFATFPPDLIEPCILAGSRAGDVVLDPFFGSGCTGEVAQNLGRRWLGCELNPAYAKLQDKRTAQQGLVL